VNLFQPDAVIIAAVPETRQRQRWKGKAFSPPPAAWLITVKPSRRQPMAQCPFSSERAVPSLRIVYILLVLSLMICGPQSVNGQRTPVEPPPAKFGLQMTLPGDVKPFLSMERGGNTVIQRRWLTVASPQSAGDLTGVDLHATPVADGMKVELWIVYNDLSNQEWWKDKKEKALGQYLVRPGVPVRPPELLDYGIIPFELSLIGYKNREFKPGEGPPIINMTTSLQVAKLERIENHYQLTLKNTSGKRIISYSVTSPGGGVSTRPAPFQRSGRSSDADLLTVRYLSAEGVESGGIKITSVVFDDGTFEGNEMEALGVLVEQEGFKIQAPSVLDRIRATLEASDSDIVSQSLKLEAGLWTIPEAIDKPSALDLLRAKYPHYDDKTIGGLYELLKSGLYDARNHALQDLGQLKPNAGEGDRLPSRIQLERARLILTRLKEDFEQVIATSK
jgi:hypothetical protein